MQIPRRNPELGTMTFAEFAKDHNEHAHCVGCFNCKGVRPPWDWENK